MYRPGDFLLHFASGGARSAVSLPDLFDLYTSSGRASRFPITVLICVHPKDLPVIDLALGSLGHLPHHLHSVLVVGKPGCERHAWPPHVTYVPEDEVRPG